MTVDDDAIVVSGIGLRSSLGGTIPAAAAFRCGMSSGQELPEWPYFDEEEHEEHFLRGHPAIGVAPGFQGIARFLKLGLMALEDLGGDIDVAKLNPARLGVILVLPASSVELERAPGELLNRLCKLGRLEVDPRNMRTAFEGRIGVVNAISEARQRLQSNQIDHCLIGAIDSLLAGDRMAELIETDKVKTVDNPVGIVPGEAACFLLLERMGRAKRRGGTIGAVMQAPSVIAPPDLEEPGPDQRPPGKVLSEVMLQALSNGGGAPTARGTLYVDLNGTTPRAVDFGNALVHLAPAYSLDRWTRAFPAESFGETGAASAAIAICMAVRAFIRGYAEGSQALVVISSAMGGKAALGLGNVN
jgi:3-oxoacyl-[acyl-carrier-protein] synthase-1